MANASQFKRAIFEWCSMSALSASLGCLGYWVFSLSESASRFRNVVSGHVRYCRVWRRGHRHGELDGENLDADSGPGLCLGGRRFYSALAPQRQNVCGF